MVSSEAIPPLACDVAFGIEAEERAMASDAGRPVAEIELRCVGLELF